MVYVVVDQDNALIVAFTTSQLAHEFVRTSDNQDLKVVPVVKLDHIPTH